MPPKGKKEKVEKVEKVNSNDHQEKNNGCLECKKKDAVILDLTKKIEPKVKKELTEEQKQKLEEKRKILAEKNERFYKLEEENKRLKNELLVKFGVQY